MKPKIYLDTSVIGGYFDEEFREDTRLFFNQIFDRKFVLYISDILFEELTGAGDEIKNLIDTIPTECVRKVELTEEGEELANKYIEYNALSKKHINDARHIAISSVNRVDALASWNYKHIVNVFRIKKYNIVNQFYGYPIIDIVTPKSIIY